MFDIKKIEMTNFKSYRGAHKFEFPQQTGLYYLTGENQRDPRLEANGAGKSTLLDAIYWCLYGTTTRGLRAGEIISRGEQSATVAVMLRIGNDVLKVTRKQSPNSLTVSEGGEATHIEEKALQRRLRLGPEAFTYSVMFPQFGRAFFDLSPTEKLALFSEISELDIWLKMSERADARATAIAVEINTFAQEKADASSSIETIQSEVEALEGKAAAFKEEQTTAYSALLMRRGNAQTALSKDKDEAVFEEKQLVRAHADVKDAKADAESATAYKNKIAQAKQELLYTRKVLGEKVAELNAEKKSFQTLGPRCITCHQKISDKHADDVLAAITAQIIAATTAITETDEIIRRKTVGMTNASTNEAGYTEGLLGLISIERSHQQRLTHLRADIRGHEGRLIEIEAQLGTEKKRENPYLSIIDDKERALSTWTKKLKVATVNHRSASEDHAATVYWVTGFKRVRLFIIEELLNGLELEVNKCLEGLGLTGWEVQFAVEKENKTGGISKGFHTFITDPSGAAKVKWESWSGGETQRLRLAGNLGLANLIMLKAGLTGAIEFYDEPSQHLSTAGMIDLAEVLRERAEAMGKKVWIADHTAVNTFGEFTGVIHAIKDKDGTSRIK